MGMLELRTIHIHGFLILKSRRWSITLKTLMNWAGLEPFVRNKVSHRLYVLRIYVVLSGKYCLLL